MLNLNTMRKYILIHVLSLPGCDQKKEKGKLTLSGKGPHSRQPRRVILTHLTRPYLSARPSTLCISLTEHFLYDCNYFQAYSAHRHT